MIKAMFSEGKEICYFLHLDQNYIMIFNRERSLIVDHVPILCPNQKIVMCSLGKKIPSFHKYFCILN